MNRKELYEEVKKQHLEEVIKEVCGKNYTLVSNKKLEEIVLLEPSKPIKNGKKACGKPKSPDTGKPAPSMCEKLIEVLKKKHILLDSEIRYIKS